MTATEKKLQREIEILKRQVGMLMDMAGLSDSDRDKLKFNEALDALERGDRTRIAEYYKIKSSQHVA